MAYLPVKRIAFLSLITVSLCGCATHIGHKMIQRERYDYNQQVINSHNEQMLLNLVRLRYNDTPLFLELNSVVTQYSFENSASLSLQSTLYHAHDAKPSADTVPGLGTGLNYAERPTITYTPLQGEEFAKNILTPIPAETIMLLSQSGWSIARLMMLCVQRINDIENAVTAAGPTPEHAPTFEQFHELAGALRGLQKAGLLSADVIKKADQRVVSIILREAKDADESIEKDRATLRKMLDLTEGQNEILLTHSPVSPEENRVRLKTRSLLGVLFFLSHAVEAPREHEEKNLVRVTRDKAGNIFDWSSVLGKLMRIHSEKDHPEEAFVAVRYRNYWFYIADSDFNSKATFGLLHYLFSLQSAEGKGQSPLLTLTASNN